MVWGQFSWHAAVAFVMAIAAATGVCMLISVYYSISRKPAAAGNEVLKGRQTA